MKSAIIPFGPRSSGSPASSEVNFRRIYADFRALDHALLDSDLGAARLAFARLQEDSPALADVIRSDVEKWESPRRTSLRLLAGSLERGILKQAQTAFDQLQQTASTDTQDPFSTAHPANRPRSFWSAISSEG
jgi:hypothetical protein